MAERFGARPHWGKFCPIDAHTVANLYPNWQEFSQLARSASDELHFVNSWLLGLIDANHA